MCYVAQDHKENFNTMTLALEAKKMEKLVTGERTLEKGAKLVRKLTTHQHKQAKLVGKLHKTLSKVGIEIHEYEVGERTHENGAGTTQRLLELDVGCEQSLRESGQAHTQQCVLPRTQRVGDPQARLQVLPRER